jgi:S-formylglutathione hydrolase FrmB
MKGKISARILLLLALALFVSLPAYGQGGIAQAKTAAAAVTVQDLKLGSKLMAREMPYRVILPVDYEKAAATRYAVVYLLHGLTGHFDNWADRTSLKEYAAGYGYIIVMPEGNNGWYSDSVAAPNDKYESYIIQELIPEIDKKYRTLADREHRAIGGLSMGGFGSIKFGLKYPAMFSVVGSFSGALGAASFNEKNAGSIGKSIDAIFGPEDSEGRKANDIFRMVREITADRMKTLPFIYLDCGTEDFLYQNNRDFADLLQKQKIPHEYRELPGGHNWVFWNSQVKEFLGVVRTKMR